MLCQERMHAIRRSTVPCRRVLCRTAHACQTHLFGLQLLLPVFAAVLLTCLRCLCFCCLASICCTFLLNFLQLTLQPGQTYLSVTHTLGPVPVWLCMNVASTACSHSPQACCSRTSTHTTRHACNALHAAQATSTGELFPIYMRQI